MRNPERQAKRIVTRWRKDATEGGWLDMEEERLARAEAFLAGARTPDNREALHGVIGDWYSGVVDDGGDQRTAARSDDAICRWMNSLIYDSVVTP